MGNRALIAFVKAGSVREGEQTYETSPTVYLHWNGGPESVFAFLKELDNRLPDRVGDTWYESARFCQVIGDWMDAEERGELSLGIMNTPTKVIFKTRNGGTSDSETYPVEVLDKEKAIENHHGDNGIYFIDRSEGTYEQHGGYEEIPTSGFIDKAYDILLEGSGSREYTKNYLVSIADTFATIDQRLYEKDLVSS